MDAPPDKPSANPSDETNVRPVRDGETMLSNAMETNMAPPWQAGETHGDFLIRGLLGRGQAGFVYAADDLVLRRRCALKVLCRMSSHDLYRNKLGFRRMSPFRHACLMRTDRIEVIDRFTVLSMEEIKGQTLAKYVPTLKAMPRQEAYQRLLALLHDYATGLSAIHMAAIVHRDLKPTNLMVREDGRGVIVDYGLVANCDPETDPYGLRPYIAGTPRYFSPEALWDQSYTPAGDVFSLGLVMLDCLNQIAGSTTWLRSGEFEDWNRSDDERTISDAVLELKDEIPEVLRDAVAMMLSGDRTDRPSSMGLVAMTTTGESPIELKMTEHLFGRENELEEILAWLKGIYCGETGRLHLHGEAGSGKTRLLDEVERQLKQHGWVQVFRVKCRSRESQTLQVLDQIADQIAARYARRDRERLKLDPVSASILGQSFPQLQHVIQADLTDASESFAGEPERLDALAAATRLSRELRKNGPLIVIIDDAQWSDHDSNTVWDELQQDTDGMLGIITSSRFAETNQRQSASKRIHVGPLPEDAAMALLQNAATRWEANINQAGLRELLEISRSNPFRLQELAEEFRPGGILHKVEHSDDSSISNLGDVDRLWRARFDRLPDEAKEILAYIVTADAPVSVAQLSELTGLRDNVDGAVIRLVDERLVHDDANGKECITVVHDKIADGLIENLDRSRLEAAHLAWARLLSKLNRLRDFAARIASHYYAAGCDADALQFAIVAAENADRAFAKSEAAEWHERVLQQVAGTAKWKHLCAAARCYREADLPDKASQLYLKLAEEAKDATERTRFKSLATELLVRSGQMEVARPLIKTLGETLGVETRFRGSDLYLGYREELHELASGLCDSAEVETEPSPSPMDREALAFCRAISRPMSMLDVRSTLRLILEGAKRAAEYGCRGDRVHFGAMAVVWHSIISDDAGILPEARSLLAQLTSPLADLGLRHESAEVWCGIAYLDTLAMRWHAVPLAVESSVRNYLLESEPLRFEISHTRWMTLWADWQMGRWKSMHAVVDEMVEDAARRNDAYQQFVATSGFGGNALLVSDRTTDLERLRADNARIATGPEEVELVDFFNWMQGVQVCLYEGKFAAAAERVTTMRQAMPRSFIRRIQLVQVVMDFLTALVSLHLQQDGASPESPIANPVAAKNAIRRLRDHQNDFALMLAELLSGIRHRIAGNPEAAIRACEAAEALAQDLELLPYQLAARDAISHLKRASAEPDSLRQQMVTDRVQCPEKLERLYTVAPPGDDSEDA